MIKLSGETRGHLLREHFIPDHLFLYVVKGSVSFFDGSVSYAYKAGECCIIRKNCLAKFRMTESAEEFEPIMFCLDEAFLQGFQKKHKAVSSTAKATSTIIKVKKSQFLDLFIRSLEPYYKGHMQLEEGFEDIKYEELLIILLKTEPQLAGTFFNYDKPSKINLEEFMNRNYKFNVSVDRFAFLTGRSLSAFKRDFKEIFNDTPTHWLVQKRLQEAYFLIDKKNKKPNEVYLELGFETMSHFSYAFKQKFGLTLSALVAQRTKGNV